MACAAWSAFSSAVISFVSATWVKVTPSSAALALASVVSLLSSTKSTLVDLEAVVLPDELLCMVQKRKRNMSEGGGWGDKARDVAGLRPAAAGKRRTVKHNEAGSRDDEEHHDRPCVALAGFALGPGVVLYTTFLSLPSRCHHNVRHIRV